MSGLLINFSRTADIEVDLYTLKHTVRAAIDATLVHESFLGNAELSVTFCDNEYIRKLNKKHRNIDKHTDVLSFPMYERDELRLVSPGEPTVLGDIVISLERAKEQAKELGNTLLREIAFLAIHSTLHLLGYDHERSADEDEEQCRLQKIIITKLEIEDEYE